MQPKSPIFMFFINKSLEETHTIYARPRSITPTSWFDKIYAETTEEAGASPRVRLLKH